MAIDKYDYYFHFMSSEMQERLKKFHFQDDRMRSLYGRVMVRLLIQKSFNIDKPMITFLRNENGKPYVHEYTNFNFNISHSGDWVICGIGEKELGVDIEKINGGQEHFAKRFFANSEYEYLMSLDYEDRIEHFYDLWTLKESYLKCIGKGLSIPLNSFELIFKRDDIFLNQNNELFKFKRFEHIPGYRISVCSQNEEIDYKIQLISI